MQFPIQTGNDTAVADGLNYLLSGPSGLGQDFNGFEAWTPAWSTGNFRIPYTQVSVNQNCTGTSGDSFVSSNPDASGILVGMSVSGYGITAGTTVTSIGSTTASGVQINLSAPITADIDNDLYFSPVPTPVLYRAPISCTTATRLDSTTFKYTFSSPQTPAPFVQGNNITAYGWTDSFYNDTWSPIGVVECTTTYVIVRSSSPYPSQPDDLAGGFVEYYNTSAVPDVYALSTDCNSKVVVNGGNDRVFITAQLNNIVNYTATTSSDLSYAVAINRYRGYPNEDVNNPGFYFQLDKLITKRVYTYTGLTGTGSLNSGLPIETIFSNFPDVSITPAYYWYILDISFQVTNGGDLQVTSSQFGLRSMSTQVVKQ